MEPTNRSWSNIHITAVVIFGEAIDLLTSNSSVQLLNTRGTTSMAVETNQSLYRMARTASLPSVSIDVNLKIWIVRLKKDIREFSWIIQVRFIL